MKPPVWSDEELERQRLLAADVFRTTRMAEPLEQYLELFEQAQSVMEELLEATVDLSDLRERLIDILTDERLREAFRYLAGPPISTDDLKVVAEARFSRALLANDPDMAERVRQVVLTGLDRRRFPWVVAQREPTEAERIAAIISSAALIATQRVATSRRHEGKNQQEAAVKAALQSIGFHQVAARDIYTVHDAPLPRTFCGEAMLGERKADLVVGLPDRRIMAIECKVSNSATNSVKRLNNDAAAKAENWRTRFGHTHVVPVAVLGGVYKTHNLAAAQRSGLTLFWEHDLRQMTAWIDSLQG